MNDADYPTIIGPDAKFKGELSFQKGVKVLGMFEGQINTDGTLVVASGAHLQADIEAGSIAVEGEVKGNMAAKDLIELKETAALQGDIRCGRLVVTDGATFIGHCQVGNGVAAPSDAPTQAAPEGSAGENA